MSKEKRNLSEKILRLKQEINTIGHNYPLLYVHIGFVDKTEKDSNRFSDCLIAMNTQVDRCLQNYEDYRAFMDLKDIYSEALILSVLSSVADIAKISEGSSRSPDFRVNHLENTIYIEMKTLNMAEGTLKHRDIMEEAFEGKIELERKIEEQKLVKTEGNIVASVMRYDMPYYSANRSYNSSSLKLVIETLIEKIRQNIKEEQFSFGDTILLINFSDQLSLCESPSESLQENYIAEYVDNSGILDYLEQHELSIEEQGKFWNSMEAVQRQQIWRYPAKGCLWHLAFGQCGTALNPEDENSEILEKEGILLEYDFIKGILFYIDGKLYACMKNSLPNSIYEFFRYLSDMKLVENQVFSFKVP